MYARFPINVRESLVSNLDITREYDGRERRSASMSLKSVFMRPEDTFADVALSTEAGWQASWSLRYC